MRNLGLVLLVYCMLAVIASVWIGMLQYAAIRRAGAATEASRIALLEATDQAGKLRNIWLELDNEQRANRAEYSGVEAVDVGYRAQEAFENYRLASGAVLQAEQQFDANEQNYRIASKNMIPLSIGLLLHALGIALFWPRRQSGTYIKPRPRG